MRGQHRTRPPGCQAFSRALGADSRVLASPDPTASTLTIIPVETAVPSAAKADVASRRLHRHARRPPSHPAAIFEADDDPVVGGVEGDGAGPGHEDRERRGRPSGSRDKWVYCDRPRRNAASS